MPEVVRDKLIGPEPDLNPSSNPIVARLEREAVPHEHCPAWHAALDTVEAGLTKHANRWLLRGLVLFLWFVEFASISVVLEQQGMANPERVIVSAAGAALLTYLFYKAGEKS